MCLAFITLVNFDAQNPLFSLQKGSTLGKKRLRRNSPYCDLRNVPEGKARMWKTRKSVLQVGLTLKRQLRCPRTAGFLLGRHTWPDWLAIGFAQVNKSSPRGEKRNCLGAPPEMSFLCSACESDSRRFVDLRFPPIRTTPNSSTRIIARIVHHARLKGNETTPRARARVWKTTRK